MRFCFANLNATEFRFYATNDTCKINSYRYKPVWYRYIKLYMTHQDAHSLLCVGHKLIFLIYQYGYMYACFKIIYNSCTFVLEWGYRNMISLLACSTRWKFGTVTLDNPPSLKDHIYKACGKNTDLFLSPYNWHLWKPLKQDGKQWLINQLHVSERERERERERESNIQDCIETISISVSHF